MLDATEDVQPFDILRDNSAQLIEQLKATHRPITLLVNSDTAVVVQEASAYRRLLEMAAEGDEREGVRQGDEDVAAGRTRSATEVFDEMRKQYGIPR
jgi:PHD/YefM family antitoxin component YafN of YafNO toxin-antitoxin module